MMADMENSEKQGGFFPKFMATFFFSGYLPKAPGTWASGFTAIILYFVWPQQWYIQFLMIWTVYLLGVFFAGKAERHLGHDAHQIVIDEVAGQMVALFMVPRAILPFVIGFVLFRFFDIVKPPPARQWESLRGGWGVMADDMAAGAYAVIVTQFLLALLLRWGINYFEI